MNVILNLKIYENGMQHDIEKFYQKCFSDLGWEYQPQGRHSDTLNIQKEYLQKGCFWCLYDGEILIGTVAVRTIDFKNKTAEMKRLYVLSDYQGKGYGNLLFKTALDYAKKNGYTKICTDTKKSRSASRHLMRKYNFKEIDRYNDNNFAELFFELDLTGDS